MRPIRASNIVCRARSLPGLRLACHVRRVLVGERDVATAIVLGYGKALFDSFDRRLQVGTFAVESLAHRL